MKKLLILLFSLLISFNSYGKTICYESNSVQNRNGLFYLPNQQEPFTGDNLCKYSWGGQYKSKGNILNGLPVGKWTIWYQNGQIGSESNYKDGKPDGKWTRWHENGQKKSERNWKDNKLGSHNVQGIKKLGKRELIEEWMGNKGIKIAGIQETHQTINSVENRKNYKWFHSGEKDGKEGSRYAGVAFIVHNELLNYINDIEPINDRIIVLTLGYAMEITIINAYAPTADKEEETNKKTIL